MPTVDGSQIKDLVPVPAQWYDAKFDKYELKQAEATGNNYDACEFTFEHEGDERRLFYNMTITEKSMWRWKRDALALGAPQEIFEGEFDTEDVLEDLLGNACRIKVEVQAKGEYAGRNQIKEIRGPQLDMEAADGDDDPNA